MTGTSRERGPGSIAKRILLALLVLVLLGGVAIVWGSRRLARGPAPPSGQLALDGLRGPVEVLRDSLGVPHVWAGSLEDALTAQGFLHATDRLWQMEMFRRVAAGRLSELFGETALSSDRFLRTIGMRRAAEASLAAADRDTERLVAAYVRGVNAAIEGWRGPLPPEFVLLLTRPEPWAAVDAFALEKVMSWDLADYDIGLTLAEARSQVDQEAFHSLLPQYPAWGVTILQEGEFESPALRTAPATAGRTEADDPSPGTGDRLDPALLASARIPEPARSFLDLGSTVRASNSWVVGGSRSRSGKPLIANDMHLALNAPNIWYLMGLHAPGIDVVGMTLPGAPGVVAGRTKGVAWGFTNATVDDSDFFVERVAPGDTTRYLTPEGTEEFVVRREEIRVRGRDEPVPLVVKETRHGPVITPVEARLGADVVAFRWIAQDPSTTFQAIVGMNRASAVDDFLRAVALFTNPHQNVVFADTAGRFGYWMAGRIPRRASGSPPLLPVPGWTGEHDWIGYLDFQEHPHVLDPERGFVVTANNRQAPGPSAELITDGTWARPYRAQRITELIEGRPVHDSGSMREIQLDVESAFVRRYRKKAEEAFRGAGLVAEAEALSAWDGRADLESTEATLFYSWIESLRTALRRSLYGDRRGYMPMRVVAEALDGSPGSLELGAGTREEAARAALQAAGGLPWGEAHQLVLSHPMADVRVVGDLLGFGRGPLPREGGPEDVNVAAYGGSSPPFRVTGGPSQRHVTDLADPDGSAMILPGGQSGYPAGDHSWDQLDRWRRGELWTMPLSRAAVEARTVSVLRLLPASGEAGTG